MPAAETLGVASSARARLVGSHWAAEVRAHTIVDRGRACGGWPGTLSEARGRVAMALTPWLATQGQRLLTFEQSERAARLVYASAREVWMAERQSE